VGATSGISRAQPGRYDSVLIEEGRRVPDAQIIAEYLDETRGASSASTACCRRLRVG